MDDEIFALTVAVCEGRCGIVPRLAHINLDTPLCFGGNPVMVARAGGLPLSVSLADDETSFFLHTFFQSIHKRYNACYHVSVLDFASYGRHVNEFAIEHRDVLQTMSTNWTPLLFAIHGRHENVVYELLKDGADPNAMHHEKVQPPLEFAFDIDEHPSNVSMVRMLLEFGADPNTVFVHSALQVATEFGLPTIVELLLHYGADPNFVPESSNSRRPIELAMSEMEPEDVSLFLRYGARAPLRRRLKKLKRLPESLRPTPENVEVVRSWIDGTHPLQLERLTLQKCLFSWRSPSGDRMPEVLIPMICDYCHFL